MQTLEQMINMIKQPGDNVLDNETLFRLLQVDASHAQLTLERQRWAPYLRTCGQLVKLLRSYNPKLPMGDGMAAQFQQLMQELEQHGG